jgi:Tol biopolymer transport system component
VAFESWATNLVPSGGDPFPDIFVRDRDTDEDGTYDEAGEVSTARVSVDSAGNEQVGPSLGPSISGDGRYVAFQSEADLVAADSGLYVDIFVHDRDADEDGIYDDEDGTYDPGEVSTVRVSVDSGGNEGNEDSSAPSISTDGRYVAFESIATNLVLPVSNGFIHIFVHDRDADEDGIYDDEDGTYDPGEVSTVQVSVDSAGTEGNADSGVPSISGNGRYVAFQSDATNLLGVGNDTNNSADVFVHDLQTGTTTRVSVDSTGSEGNGDSHSPSISSDGRYVAFESDADNLVGAGNDTNGSTDIFVHDRQTGITTRVSVDTAGNEGNGISRDPSISADSKYVSFESAADNLVGAGNDTNGFFDIFLYEREAPQSEENSSGNGWCLIVTSAHGTSMRGQVRVVRGVLLAILLITIVRFSYNRLRPHEK